MVSKQLIRPNKIHTSLNGAAGVGGTWWEVRTMQLELAQGKIQANNSSMRQNKYPGYV